jgi:hypothetical protein
MERCLAPTALAEALICGDVRLYVPTREGDDVASHHT